MGESEGERPVTWLADPPASWADAPAAPPATHPVEDVTASGVGGLLLHVEGERTRFVFSTDPVPVRR